jgi:hypothetical protein
VDSRIEYSSKCIPDDDTTFTHLGVLRLLDAYRYVRHENNHNVISRRLFQQVLQFTLFTAYGTAENELATKIAKRKKIDFHTIRMTT